MPECSPKVKPLKVADPFGLAKKRIANKKAHPKSSFTVAQWENAIRYNNSYVKIVGHGGGCCGYKHLRMFPAYDIMWELEAAKSIKNCFKSWPGQIIEAILIGSQASEKDYAWTKFLIKQGFRLVSSNTNSNSSNENFVFHLCSQEIKSSKRLKDIQKLEQLAKENPVV